MHVSRGTCKVHTSCPTVIICIITFARLLTPTRAAVNLSSDHYSSRRRCILLCHENRFVLAQCISVAGTWIDAKPLLLCFLECLDGNESEMCRVNESEMYHVMSSKELRSIDDLMI